MWGVLATPPAGVGAGGVVSRSWAGGVVFGGAQAIGEQRALAPVQDLPEGLC